MLELRLAPGPGIPSGLVISAEELTERFTHSSGPGGQGVNTADSRVQLCFDIATSAAFTTAQRDRLLSTLDARLDQGVIMIEASNSRSQYRNRLDARARLAALLREALAPPPPRRRATRPTRGSIERRLAAKKRRSELKQHRGRAPLN